MCGIAGFAGSLAEGPDAADRLRRMCDAIRHRGPDDSGYHVAPGVAIGMRRLSIIDVAGGHQPMTNEDGTVHVVFNGEIYNYQPLRARLLAGRHRLTTSSDTETLVHLYEDHGAGLARELRGMFGFAIWDDRRRRLLVARDRLGIKPLYYWPTRDGVAFASELRTIFTGVHKLLPGSLLEWTREGGVRTERYWSPAVAENTRITEQEAIEETRRLLDESVRIHLLSEVPLGAFLSGGIDSSGVVATMARISDRPVRTFSIGFAEREFDESRHAAEVASALGTEHTQLVVRPDAELLFEQVARALDEPFGDPSALPTFLVSYLARRDVTVALSGDGGDELFGGYTRYFELNGARSLPPLARTVLRNVALRLPHAPYGRNRLLALGRTM